MTARRATALLLRIPEHERKSIRVRSSLPTPPISSATQNLLQWAGRNAQREDLKPMFAPLDWIHAVWRDDLQNEWQIVVDAILNVERDRFVPYQRVS